MKSESLDRNLSIFPRRIEGTDKFIVVMELGGIDGVDEDTALDVVKIFDQLFPTMFEPVMNLAREVLDND